MELFIRKKDGKGSFSFVPAPTGDEMKGMVPKSGKATIGKTAGDQALRWSSLVNYPEKTPNQVVERVVDAPMSFCLDNFNSTKLENVVLASGDPATAVHPLIANGMVRKTALGMVETVTEVEWSETKISHKYRTNTISGPPCCLIHGYAAEMSVETVEGNKTRIINKAHQAAKCCSPLMICCCMQLCWDKVGNSFLVADIDALEKKWKVEGATMDR